jgi:hypothetical protein
MLDEDTETRLSLPGTISERGRAFARMTAMSVALALTGVTALGATYATMTMRTLSQAPADEVQEVIARDELEAVGADEVSEIVSSGCERDKTGRYVITAEIRGKSDVPYDVYLTCDANVTGGDEHDPWAGTISHISCDCMCQDTYMDKTYIVVANLKPDETRKLTLYPDFSDGTGAPVKITAVSELTLEYDKAWPTETILPTAEDVALVETLSKDASIMTLSAKTEKATLDTPSLTVEAALLDVHNEPVGAKYSENVDFPFGIVTVKGTMPAHEVGSRGYMRLDCDTAGVARRAFVTSVHR